MQADMCVCACDVYDMYVYVSNLSCFSAFVTLFIFFLEFCLSLLIAEFMVVMAGFYSCIYQFLEACFKRHVLNLTT